MKKIIITLEIPGMRLRASLRLIIACLVLVGCSDQVADSTTPALPAAVESVPMPVPDFASYTNTAEKKQHFFEYIQKFAKKSNDRVWSERLYVLDFQERYQNSEVTPEHAADFAKLADRYKLPVPEILDESYFESLLLRVDVVPASLVLAQAANESAWGTSRFARDGKNFFGIWCYQPGCGLKPRAAKAGTKHQVRRFETVQKGVSAYIHNINIGHAYDHLRKLRAEARAEGEPPTGHELAEGLIRYSERGQAYIDEVQHMIRSNKLAEYSTVRSL